MPEGNFASVWGGEKEGVPEGACPSVGLAVFPAHSEHSFPAPSSKGRMS